MNTIRHARRRPRKRSANLRTLWWLLAREAAWCVMVGDPTYRIGRNRAFTFSAHSTEQVTRAALDTIRLSERRRIYP